MLWGFIHGIFFAAITDETSVKWINLFSTFIFMLCIITVWVVNQIVRDIERNNRIVFNRITMQLGLGFMNSKR